MRHPDPFPRRLCTMLNNRLTPSLLIFALLLAQSGCSGFGSGGNSGAPRGSKSQPRFKPGFNLFSPQQDVQIGEQSAAQVLHETPMLDDAEISGYVNQLGR